MRLNSEKHVDLGVRFRVVTAAVGPHDVIVISHVSLTAKGIYERVGRPTARPARNELAVLRSYKSKYF